MFNQQCQLLAPILEEELELETATRQEAAQREEREAQLVKCAALIVPRQAGAP